MPEIKSEKKKLSAQQLIWCNSYLLVMMGFIYAKATIVIQACLPKYASISSLKRALVSVCYKFVSPALGVSVKSVRLVVGSREIGVIFPVMSY